MYNHFGYRTPIERLYMAGSACHPGGAISGGAGYISAGIIARDLGAEAVVEAVGRRRGVAVDTGDGGLVRPCHIIPSPSSGRVA